MAIKKLDPSQWEDYFTDYSRFFIKGKQPNYVEIRVFSDEIGAQPETSWLPLIGITYDKKNDLLEIAIENMDHMILHPAEVFVDEVGEHVIGSLQVIRKDGTKEVIELR